MGSRNGQFWFLLAVFNGTSLVQAPGVYESVNTLVPVHQWEDVRAIGQKRSL